MSIGNVIDGKRFQGLYEEFLRGGVERHLANGQRPPGLGVILVGDDPASQTYVAAKERFAARVGIVSREVRHSASVTRDELLDTINGLNDAPDIDGILLQLPLPRHLSQGEFLSRISPAKDADALHPYNQGLLLQGREIVVPCTPLGVVALLDYAYGRLARGVECGPADLQPVRLAGKRVVVIGRSVLVGKPLGLLLLARDATVIMAHSKTANLPELCRTADIVVAAVGVPKLVKKSWIRPGAIVIDVGINRTAEGSLVGDVDYDEVAPIATAITPVPGGVGPMTVAMLMRNTIRLYEERLGVASTIVTGQAGDSRVD